MSRENLLIVFARPPVAGMVKTRLIPVLGEEGAAVLYRKLLFHTLDRVIDGVHWDTELWLTNDLMPDFFQKLEKDYALTIKHQHGEDLGQRMYHALSLSLNNYRKVALIGTDCPALDSELIKETFELLDDNDIVVSPAEDGGYVQIAARKIEDIIFKNIDWGSERVLSQTQRRLSESGLSVAYTDVYWDIDMPQDLIRLKQAFYALAKELPPE